MSALKISVNPAKLVVVTENHGGYTGGRCVVCGAAGWLCEQEYGLPHSSTSKANALRHKKGCAVGAALNNKGRLRQAGTSARGGRT